MALRKRKVHAAVVDVFFATSHVFFLTGLGLDKAIEEGKTRMSRYGVKPNMLVVGPQLLLYMALAPDEKINYSFAGPAGPERFEAGVQGYETRAFRGLGVFQSLPFEVSDDSDALQMLQRSTQIGEYYVCPKAGVVIYDEEQDKLVKIEQADAEAAGDVTAPGDDDDTALIIVRPFIEHTMMSAVMAVAGRDTGATLFGPADMQISANTSVKTIEGHYVRSHTPQIHTPPIMRD
jgi:hypothetical protein